MPSDNLTFLIGFVAVFGALGWYLWHLEREVARLAQRLDDARASLHPGAPPRPDDDRDRHGAGRLAHAADQEAPHVERDVSALPHHPRGDGRRSEADGGAPEAKRVEDEATRAKRQGGEGGP